MSDCRLLEQEMKHFKSALMIGIFAISNSYVVHAENTLGKVAKNAQTQTQSIVEQTSNELVRVMAGLKNYYSNSLGWPTTISQISNYYSGNYKTPLGTIKGNLSATRYELVIDVTVQDEQTIALIKSMSSKLKGVYNEPTKQIVIPVDAPQEAAIVSSMLSRFPDTSGNGLNTMRTDLDMGNNDINNIKDVNAVNVSSTVVNATTVNADQFTGTVADLTTVNSTTTNSMIVNAQQIASPTGLIAVNSNTKFTGSVEVNGASSFNGAASFAGTITQNDGQHANLGVLNVKNGANFSGSIIQAAGQQADLGILTAQKATVGELHSNGIAYFSSGIRTATGIPIADEFGKLFYAGQDADLRYLGLNATATNSNKLGGVDANRFARTDISNVFTSPQTFNGINVNGNGTFNGSISAASIYTSGDISVNNILLRSKGVYLSSIYDKVYGNHEPRISALEAKMNAPSSGNKMGSWVYISTSYSSSPSPSYHTILPTILSGWGSCVVGLRGYVPGYVGGGNNGGTNRYEYYECK